MRSHDIVQLLAMLEGLEVGLLETDLEGRILTTNARFCVIVGRPAAELAGARLHDLIHPDDRDGVEVALSELRRGVRPADLESRVLHPSGRRVWAQSRIAAVPHQPSLVSLVEDVTERRQLEEDRLKIVDELQRTVRITEMFVGILSHDLRNPLSAITTAGALLLRRMDGQDRLTALVTRVLGSADRMRRMIDQLLDFTRVRAGLGMPLERQPLDLVDACRQVIDEIVTDEATEVRVEALGDTRGAWDRDRVLQLVSNLTANAVIHRVPATPVALTVDGRHPRRIELTIHNQGHVPPEMLPVLFQPFHAVRQPRRRGTSGLGLGLYITQQIAQAHGGEVRVQSGEVDGTRFVVELPRGTAEAA